MHKAVLLQETIELLQVRSDGCYLDATLGRGGHTRGILERLGESGRLLALDRDAEAAMRERDALSDHGDRCRVRHANFADMASVVADEGFGALDGIVMDLGVSSDQLDTPERGFSFQVDGPLDMRMDRTAALTAAELVNTLDEDILMQVIRENGEEPRARAIARAIVRAREAAPFETTLQLAEVAGRAAGGRRGKTHPATRTFQALRIAVNAELSSLETALESGLGLLAPGGRMAVITFHSLEDRPVKQCFARHAGRWESLMEGGRAWQGTPPRVTRITRKPVTASDEELADNPRARSAKLRVVEREAGNVTEGE